MPADPSNKQVHGHPLDCPCDHDTLVNKAKLEPPAMAQYRPGMTVRQFLGQLIAAEQYPAAVRLLAWRLPRREAVWWVCTCVLEVLGDKDKPAERAALEAALRWVQSPTEENRRAAEVASASANYGTPAGCAAMAAFWSGGSLAPPKMNVVPPPEHLLPGAVSNSILLSMARSAPDKVAANYCRWLEVGIAVADGTSRWKEDKPSAPPTKPVVGRK